MGCSSSSDPIPGDRRSGYRVDVTDAAAQAVFICSAFKDVIENSPYAAPIRNVLGDVETRTLARSRS